MRGLEEYPPEYADYLRVMLAILFRQRGHTDTFHHPLEKALLTVLIFCTKNQLGEILLERAVTVNAVNLPRAANSQLQRQATSRSIIAPYAPVSIRNSPGMCLPSSSSCRLHAPGINGPASSNR
jgi:hypothetical protein